ncbi:hypothetical protein J2S43_001370 [Catenuloplanes nepalensis]|uniref:Uncharacterized protein n=1 Tax=Catenuloplanes nepalensis TaxID=587533 RepID=A0ABT9MNK2_9ACTN|nr:hypothetical protein [Catenuloplanes nepalensis]MDP9792858.1 hypothetical protein [Catenuloplanes nepalensis]
MTTVPDPQEQPGFERPIDLTDTPEHDRPGSVPTPEHPDESTPAAEPGGRPAPDVTPMS